MNGHILPEQVNSTLSVIAVLIGLLILIPTIISALRRVSRDEHMDVLRKAIDAQTFARMAGKYAERLTQANKTIGHLEHCLRKSNRRQKSQHRLLRSLQARGSVEPMAPMHITDPPRWERKP